MSRVWPVRSEQLLTFAPLPPLYLGQPVVLPAYASSGLPINYNVFGPAILEDNLLTATALGPITITAYQRGDASWLETLPVMHTVNAQAPVSAQQSWRQAHFGTTANAGETADTADFDKDGLPNLLEFAFGLTPTSGASAAAQLPQPQHNAAAQTFTCTFTEPLETAGSGLIYSASASTSLQPGSWINVPDTGSGTTHIFIVPTTGQQQMFLQLHVTAP